MDIRIEKTEKGIRNAFLELRAHKPLEKITVKELCALAHINKSTFYSHYQDIYALADVLEDEFIRSMLLSMDVESQLNSGDIEGLTRALTMAFLANRSLLNLLFRGRGQNRLAEKIDSAIQEVIFSAHPQLRGDPTQQILLSYATQGAYYAFLSNQDAELNLLLDTIGRASARLYNQLG